MNKFSLTKKARVARAATLAVLCSVIVLLLIFFCWQRYVVRPYLYSPELKTLLYHLVSDETYGDYTYLFVRKDDFEAQLAEIQKQDLPTYFADEPERAGRKPGVVITFDDGYVDNYTTVFPLLQKYNMKATIFIITDLLGTEGHLTEAQIKEMSESGLVHFGSHTASHSKLDTLTADEIRQEFISSKEIIEEITGKPVTALAYPNGVYTEDAEQIATEVGYRYAYTTDVPEHAYYENSRLPRSYVVRDMAWDEFLELLSLSS